MSDELEETNLILQAGEYEDCRNYFDLIQNHSRAKTSSEEIEGILSKYPLLMKNSSFNGAVQVFDEMLRFLAIDTKGLFLKRIFDERLYGEMFGLKLTYFHYLYEVLDRKLQQMFVGGIIEHYNSEYYDYLNIKRYEHLHPSGPQILTLEHLRAGFVVWLVSVIFAILTFGWEWIMVLFDYVISRFIFEAYFEFLNSEMRRKQTVRCSETVKQKNKEDGNKSVDELIEMLTLNAKPSWKGGKMSKKMMKSIKNNQVGIQNSLL